MFLAFVCGALALVSGCDFASCGKKCSHECSSEQATEENAKQVTEVAAQDALAADSDAVDAEDVAAAVEASE